MKRVLWLSLVVTAGFAVVLFAAIPATATAPNGFAGNWEGTDPDGSRVTWRIQVERGSEGQAFLLTGADDLCSSCGGEKALLRGVGIEHDPNVLSVGVVAWGLGDSLDLFGPFESEMLYDPSTDTIWDGAVEYHRLGSQN